MRVASRLLCGRVGVIVFAAEQGEPLAELKHFRLVVVTWTTFNQSDSDVWVGREPFCQYAACRAASDDDVVVFGQASER